MSKNEVPERVPENATFFDGLSVGKGEVLKVRNPPKCLIYKNFGGFRGLRENREFHEKRCPNRYQK